MNVDELDEFTRAYCETALWSTNDESTPEGGEPLDKNYDLGDIAPDTLTKMKEDCAKFQQEHGHLFTTENCLRYGPDYGPDGRAGHDFWLTRHHHGAGFWDGDWEADVGELLTNAAQAYKEVNLYVGDDGKIHCE
jgi:hypothetical protein